MSKSAQSEQSVPGSHRTMDRQVLQIASQISHSIGNQFFRSVSDHLAEELDADCVFVGEFLGGQTERVRTLAACLDRKPDSFEYELAGSASAQLALGKPCLCRAHALERFPDDPVFARLGAQACVGIPLMNSSGLPLGIVMAVYRKPIPNPDVPKTILEIFAPRAAAELERKQQDEQLRQSEQRHRAFIALNTDGMGRIEFEKPISTALPEQEQLERIYQEGYLAECNDALARQCGLEKAEELIGSRLVDLAPLSNPSVRNATLHAIRSGYRFNRVETSPVGRDGKPRFILRSQWGIVDDGTLQRIWGSTRDITDLKRSEIELDEREQRMADLLESLPLMVVMLHPNGEIDFCNQRLFQLTGWKQGDVAGKKWLELMIPAEDRARVSAILAAGNTAPPHPVHFESPLLGPHGDRHWIAWDSTTLRDADGKGAATAIVGSNITDFKALEARFYQAQKLESIGRLAGGLAHDFNNLLTLIMGLCGALLEKNAPSDHAHTNLDEIRKAAEKGVDLTQRLFTFSQQRPFRPEVVNLTNLIAGDGHMIRQLIGEDIQIITGLDPSLWLVRADPGHIHQIVLNLVVNARDAMPLGGTLTVSTSNTVIGASAPGVSGAVPGEYVRSTVTDTGTGMTEEVRSHVFEPFYTTKAQGQGTGLGLSTVYGIVQQSGGHIVVETVPGGGTSFSILLPKAQGASHPEKSAKKSR